MTGNALRSTALTVLIGILVTVCGMNSTAFSTAAYTAQSVNTASTASAAVDWTPPTVTVNSPAGPVKGTTTITAQAADGETGVKSVTLQVQLASGWSDLCIKTVAPYACTWETSSAPDGSYALRAVAVDNAGYSTTSQTVTATVANAFGIILTDPGDTLRGSATLVATLQNANVLALYNVRIEYSVAGSGRWSTAGSCLSILGSANCTVTWATNGLLTSVPSGSYDLRAVATTVLGSTTATSVIYTDVIVDNTAPSVTMTDPGSPLSGTVTLSAAASDADSDIASVAIQYAPATTGVWSTACTVTQPPFSCRFVTTSLPSGRYSFRAIATDNAGNTTTSTAVTNRQIDNTVSSVSVEYPGGFLSGSTSVTADANSTAGVTSVTIQYSPAGSGTWTTLCRTTTAPYTCPWNTTTLPDGAYDLRAVLIDGSDRTTISSLVAGLRIDNTPVRGRDAQTANGPGVPGRLDSGDSITFTYSKQMATGSILPGWDGSATAVTLRLRDGGLLGRGSAGDTIDVLSGSRGVALGSVNLRGDYIKPNKTSTSTATMTASTITVDGQPVTVVTITVGTLSSGGALRTAGVAGTIVWSPSATATDLSGAPCSTAPIAESGPNDREF